MLFFYGKIKKYIYIIYWEKDMYRIMDYCEEIRSNERAINLINQVGFYKGSFVEVEGDYIYLFGLREIGVRKSMFILKEIN